MKLILDENCENLKQYLEKLGWCVNVATDVISKLPNSKSVEDNQIVNYAKEKKTVVITYDKGLKALCEEYSVPHLDPSSPAYQANILDKELKKRQSWKAFL